MSSKPLKQSKKSSKAMDPILNNYRFDVNDEIYCCKECDYSTHSKNYVRNHMISHSNERPFVCHFFKCKQSYKRSSDLKRHINNFHLGIKQYVCDTCGKGMTNGQTLRDHISAIHLKLKPFLCHINQCGKRFGLKKNMISHQKRRHFKTESNQNNVADQNNGQFGHQNKDDTDEENDLKNNRYKTRANSSVSNGHKNGFTINCRQSSHEINTSKSSRNGFKNSSNQELSPIKSKRNHDKKNDKNESNNYLFECNFIGCEFNTYVWEQIADHFVDHWEKFISFN